MIGYAGLDVSQADVHVCLMRADDDATGTCWTVPNTQTGADALIARLRDRCPQAPITDLRLGVEATGLLWWHLACALVQTPPLQPLPPRLYVLNPHLVSRFRANYGAAAIHRATGHWPVPRAPLPHTGHLTVPG